MSGSSSLHGKLFPVSVSAFDDTHHVAHTEANLVAQSRWLSFLYPQLLGGEPKATKLDLFGGSGVVSHGGIP